MESQKAYRFVQGNGIVYMPLMQFDFLHYLSGRANNFVISIDIIRGLGSIFNVRRAFLSSMTVSKGALKAAF